MLQSWGGVKDFEMWYVDCDFNKIKDKKIKLLIQKSIFLLSVTVKNQLICLCQIYLFEMHYSFFLVLLWIPSLKIPFLGTSTVDR